MQGAPRARDGDTCFRKFSRVSVSTDSLALALTVACATCNEPPAHLSPRLSRIILEELVHYAPVQLGA